jgi:O-methyltransferase
MATQQLMIPASKQKFKRLGKALRFRLQLRSLYDKYKGFTMISESTFLANLKLCWAYKDVPGIIIECGVWRGGMIAAISEVLGNQRKYYLFDSFEGLPPVQEIDGEAAKKWQSDTFGTMYHDNCKAEQSYAREAMDLANCYNYHLVKGWFSDTLPSFNSEEQIAILRLDGDWYESTIQCLTALYPKVTSGGVIILDDYYTWDGCSKALHDYLSAHSLPDKIYQIHGNCYLIKN